MPSNRLELVFGEEYVQVLMESWQRLFCSFMTNIDYSEYEDVDD